MFPVVINTLEGILILIGINAISISNIVFILLYQKYKNELRIARLTKQNDYRTDSTDNTKQKRKMLAPAKKSKCPIRIPPSKDITIFIKSSPIQGV